MLYLHFPQWINPVLIPGLNLRWYGLMYLVAFVITLLLFRRQVRQEGLEISDDDITSYFVWAMIGLLLGARILYALVYDTTRELLSRPWLIFWPFRDGRFVGLAGMSYHGGLIGAVAGCLLFTRKKKFKSLQWGDWLTAAIPLGYTFGRLGNFINGELWGRVTDSPVGMLFPTATGVPIDGPGVRELAENVGIDLSQAAYTNAWGEVVVNLPRHPSQLYEALLEGVVLWLVLWFVIRPLKRRKGLFHGILIGSYLIGYGVARIIVEYFRQPDPQKGFLFGADDLPIWLTGGVGYLTTGQVLSWIMVFAGVFLLFFFRRRHRRPGKVGSR